MAQLNDGPDVGREVVLLVALSRRKGRPAIHTDLLASDGHLRVARMSSSTRSSMTSSLMSLPGSELLPSLGMKKLLLLLPLLQMLPASAETWVTVVSVPLRPIDPYNIVDYQIDVDSIRSDEYMTSANTKWTYKDETEKVLAVCGQSKLMINSERSDAYWIKRKGKDWFGDTNKDGSTFHLHGEPYSESQPDKDNFNEWFSKTFDLLCEDKDKRRHLDGNS